MAYMNPGTYGYYGGMPQVPRYQPPDYGQVSLKGRPVSSFEEARAAQIDFDGSMFVFPDMAHQKIYTKQINLDGTASLNTYSLVEDKTQQGHAYVTHNELEGIVKDIMGRIEGIYHEQQSNAATSKPSDQLSAF